MIIDRAIIPTAVVVLCALLIRDLHDKVVERFAGLGIELMGNFDWNHDYVPGLSVFFSPPSIPVPA